MADSVVVVVVVRVVIALAQEHQAAALPQNLNSRWFSERPIRLRSALAAQQQRQRVQMLLMGQTLFLI